MTLDAEQQINAQLEDPALIDRSDAAGEVARRAEAYRNWGRWGEDDVLGTLNFITPAKRVEAAGLIRDGLTVSLGQELNEAVPQQGWKNPNQPVQIRTGTRRAHEHNI